MKKTHEDKKYNNAYIDFDPLKKRKRLKGKITEEGIRRLNDALNEEIEGDPIYKDKHD